MAKGYDNKYKITHHYYVERNYTARQVAEMLDIAPKTVGEWVRKYVWKQGRQAREISVGSREESRDQILSDLTTDRRRIREFIVEQEVSSRPDGRLIRELRKQISRIDDTVSKWNEARITAQKDERVPLDIYLQVTDNTFDSLELFDMELHTWTLDFQEQHICQIPDNKQQMTLTQSEKQARERYLEKLKFARNGSWVNPFESKEKQQAAIRGAQEDAEFMVEHCLPHYTTSKCAPFQSRLANRMARDPQCMELIRWGRGLAKSVQCDLITPLWLQVRGESVYLVIVGNNQDKAELLLADIQVEFEGSPQLIKDFGGLKQNGGQGYTNLRMADGRFMEKAIGMGTSPRGLRIGALRPNPPVADDLEDEDTVKNPAQQDEVVQWTRADLIPTMDEPVQCYLHPDNDFTPCTVQSQLEERHPDWYVGIVKAYDKETYAPAWP